MKKKQNSKPNLWTTSRPLIIGILAAIVAAGGSYGGYTVWKGDAPPHTDVFEMQRVIDGDTFELTDGTRIRLGGINAPEVGTCYADESTQALTRMLSGQKLRLVQDVTGADDFGRLIRFVFSDEQDPYNENDNAHVNVDMLRGGYAVFVSGPDKLYQKVLVQAESEARSAGRGLWGACKGTLDPAAFEGRKKSVMNHVLPPNDTCVIKGNISDSGLGKTYFLPTCAAYSEIKIDTNKGEMYFCSEKDALKAGFKKSGSCIH